MFQLVLGAAFTFPSLTDPAFYAVASVLFLVLVVLTIFIILLKCGTWDVSHATPEFFFWLEMGYLAILAAIAAVYMTCCPQESALIGKIVPMPVIWFGALGAVVIGLEGVFMHNASWETKYNFWHVGRPLFGAVLGLVAFYIMVLILKSAGTIPKFLQHDSQHPLATPAVDQLDFLLFYVLSFLVGYREETFRELIKRATDLILAPGKPVAEIPSITISIDGKVSPTVEFDPRAIAQPAATKSIQIRNSSNVALQNLRARIVAVAPENVTAFTFVDPNPLDGTANLAANGGSQTLTISFHPTAATAYKAKLIVEGANLAQQAIPINGQGTN